MKNFLFLMLGILMFSCNKEDVLNEPYQNTNKGNISKVFSGVKRSPQTKGVAQERNLWRAGMTLRIKFLDGTTEEHDKVKEYAKEWMKYANIKFDYITTGNADVRITFEDDAKEISWSYIGSDAKAVPDQSKPTANLAYFGFFDDDEEDRAGVLRLFGQILGLELEHRHLDFDPKWNPKKDIEDYWTENITDTPWELLKEYVLEPLIDDQVIQTEEFDSESIMKWGFPKGWSTVATLLEKNMNSELSDMDKEFIALLYPFPATSNATIIGISVIKEEVLNFNEVLKTDAYVEIDFGDGEFYKGAGNLVPDHLYYTGDYSISIVADKISLDIGQTQSAFGVIFLRREFLKYVKLNDITEYTHVYFGWSGLEKLEIENAPRLLQTSFDYCFNYCTYLTSIPERLFENTADVTSFVGCFTACANITSIPENLFKKNIKAENFEICFMGCINLKSIPENLFKYNTEVVSFNYCFRACSDVTTIPENLFKYNIKATILAGCFSACTGITNIPENLFKYNTSAVDFSSCLRECTSLTTIPNNLFKYNTKIDNLDLCFFSCNSLISIPEDIFKYNINVTKFKRCFEQCSSLTSIPENLFKHNTKVVSFSQCFSLCSSLTSIPENLFKYNTEVVSFEHCFKGCNSLTSIPSDLFTHNTKVESFVLCFDQCSSLTSIPENLFKHNTEVVYFNLCFYQCYSLTSIPENLFKHNTEVVSFNNCFSLCSSLTSIPYDLFTHNTKIEDFAFCFYKCNSLTGNIPKLWETHSQAKGFGCFQDCTNASNYNEIPSKWIQY